MYLRSFTAIIIVTLIGCGPKNNEDSALLAENNSEGNDVTILQAWLSDDDIAIQTGNQSDDILGAEILLNGDWCQEIRSSTSQSSGGEIWTTKTVNCRTELSKKTHLPGNNTDSPVLGSVVHTFQKNVTRDRLYHRSGKCEMIEFRTVTRDAALNADSFSGLGFYFSGNDVNPIFIPKSSLHAVGNVTMKDGSPATVHRFIAQGMCYGLGGNGGSIAYRNYNFRPFAQFDASGDSYRVWDNVESDYLLGRDRSNTSVFVRNFDRQNELLRQ